MFKRALAGTTLAALFATVVPAAPALADGAASTRNILLGIGAATYLIIQHNRKVHQKYAEDARRQAEISSQRDDAWAAYNSERNAYAQQVAVNQELQHEVAYQHQVVMQVQHQIAMVNRSNGSQNVAARTVYVRQPVQTAQNARPTSNGQQVAMVDYGWGQL